MGVALKSTHTHTHKRHARFDYIRIPRELLDMGARAPKGDPGLK